MAHLLRSSRLTYRAAEAEDEALLFVIQTDPKYLKEIQEALLSVVICLSPSETVQGPMPIGVLNLSQLSPSMAHHRFTEIVIDIASPYQGLGYGSEAIEWALQWAFEVAGMHRVAISCFEWNDGARRLYRKLGFKEEGVRRKNLWHAGRWWDDTSFGMIDREWREMQAQKTSAKAASRD